MVRWTEPITLAGMVAGVVASIGFAMWEPRHRAPLLDIRLFAKRSLANGSVTLLVWALGWSDLMATPGLMPMAVLMLLRMIAMGLGMGPSMAPSTTAATSLLPRGRLGVARHSTM